jgi:hypothetical protein
MHHRPPADARRRHRSQTGQVRHRAPSYNLDVERLRYPHPGTERRRCLGVLFWTDTIPGVWPYTAFTVVDLT